MLRDKGHPAKALEVPVLNDGSRFYVRRGRLLRACGSSSTRDTGSNPCACGERCIGRGIGSRRTLVGVVLLLRAGLRSFSAGLRCVLVPDRAAGPLVAGQGALLVNARELAKQIVLEKLLDVAARV